MSNTTKKIANAIQDAAKNKTAPYDTTATVKRVEGGTAWVHIPGGVDETPVKMTIAAKPGETVQVRVSGGSAFLVGNGSSPPTDDSRAIRAEATAVSANAIAENAAIDANWAHEAADAAYALASTAKRSADGKNMIYRQSSQPTGGTYVAGDVWFDTAHDNKIHRYDEDSHSWVAFTLGDDAIGDLNASHINAGTIDASQITVSNLDAGNITTGNLGADRIKTHVVSAINATADKIDAKNINASQITVGDLSDGSNYSTTAQMNTAISGAVDGANFRTQYIYISKVSGTNTVSANTTWVSDATGSQNTWTTKRPQYSSSYPVLFIAKQSQTMAQSGGSTCSCTTPVKDDTTTVIDGGHITTGTIDASQVTVTNIDASKITVNKIQASQIQTSGITIGQSQVTNLTTDLSNRPTTTTMNTAISGAVDGIDVGSRNLLIGSDYLYNKVYAYSSATLTKTSGVTVADWSATDATTISGTGGSDVIVMIGYALANYIAQSPMTQTIGETYSFSVYVKNNHASNAIRVRPNGSASAGSVGYKTVNAGEAKLLTWTWTASAASYIQFNIATLSAGNAFNVTLWHPMYVVGNKATSWNPAPEDPASTATSYITQIDDGGINVHDVNSGYYTHIDGNSISLNDPDGNSGFSVASSGNTDSRTINKNFVLTSTNTVANFVAPISTTTISFKVTPSGGSTTTATKTNSTFAVGSSFTLGSGTVTFKRVKANEIRATLSGSTRTQIGISYTNSADYAKVNFIGNNNVLLDISGAFMIDTQTYTFTESVSEQLNGIVLCWCAYVDGTVQNYDWNYTYIPKDHAVRGYAGIGTGLLTSAFQVGGTSYWGFKYVYIDDTTITGHAGNNKDNTFNGIPITNRHWVLRYVLGV